MDLDGPLGASTPTRRDDKSAAAAMSPIKMKIRIGKNNVGTAVVSRGTAGSPGKQRPAPVPDTVTESPEGFHGFADSEVPQFVFDDFSSFDLKTPFKASSSFYQPSLQQLRYNKISLSFLLYFT